MRERYKNLNIPPFTFDSQESYSHNDGTCAVLKDSVFYTGDQIVDWIDGKIRLPVAIKNILKYKAPRYEPIINSEQNLEHFKLLHEKGHNDLAQKGVTCINRAKMNTGIAVLTVALWGKHKNKPYKNVFTKLGSKGIAVAVITTAMHTATARFHEVYADNYAYKHVKDKEALEVVQRDLINKITKSNQASDKLGVPLILRGPIEFCRNPYHPSMKSRLAQIQKTIDSRFPTV